MGFVNIWVPQMFMNPIGYIENPLYWKLSYIFDFGYFVVNLPLTNRSSSDFCVQSLFERGFLKKENRLKLIRMPDVELQPVEWLWYPFILFGKPLSLYALRRCVLSVMHSPIWNHASHLRFYIRQRRTASTISSGHA